MRKSKKYQLIAAISFTVFLFILLPLVYSNVLYAALTEAFGYATSGVVAFALLLPICVSLFFFGKNFKYWGKYYKKKKNNAIGNTLMIIALTVFALAIIQLLLSCFGIFTA